MATTEEKQDLVDKLKGPRYYRITLYGYGGESAYINLSEDAFNFWKPVFDEHGDSDLVTYMVNAEDQDWEFENIETVPDNANFMKDPEGDYRPWYEHHNEYAHQYGAPYDSTRIEIDELDGVEYSSKTINTLVEGEELSDYTNRIDEASNYELEIVQSGEEDYFKDQGKYVCQFYSAEKGTFFDGIIETTGDFDPKKLKIIIDEFPNGEDVVTSIQYDGKEVDNNGGDTNGKGYSVHLWSN